VIASTTVMAFAAGGFGAWFLEFLETEKGMSKGQASTLFGLALFGGLGGVLAGGGSQIACGVAASRGGCGRSCSASP